MLFRPVYLRSTPLQYEPPPTIVIKLPPKEPTPPPPPKEPTPPPVVPEPPPPIKYHIPMLICSKGLTAVYPHEATHDVLEGKVDYFLVDDRGVTMYQKKHTVMPTKLETGREEEKEKKEEKERGKEVHQMVLKRRKEKHLVFSRGLRPYRDEEDSDDDVSGRIRERI